MTPEEMKGVLERLGIEIVSTNGDEITAHCPAHLERTGKEDANPSWFINANSGKHICFSCHFKGGLNTLIKYCAGEEYEDVGQWLNLGGSNLVRRLEKALRPTPTVEKVRSEVTESMLSAFTAPPSEELLKRGLTLTASDYYGLLWNPVHESWIIPLRDPVNRKLIGWQEKWAHERRFINFPKGLSKASSLFGYERYEAQDMVVVESPLDVVRLASVGIFGGVAVCGSVISRDQINLIRSADRVIVAMDNDKAGKEAATHLLGMSKDMGFDCWFFNYSETDQKDIGGMSKSEIVFGINNARHSLRGKRALV